MSEPLTLLAVHAHPDDEAISTGGVLASYADEGVRTVLVTCTGGEVGEIAHPDLATAESLGEIRRRELAQAASILRLERLHLLGYRDSGMAGTPDNDHPASFHRADLEQATARLVALIRQERPQVLVTYDDNGFYGHPDHIQANRVTVAAFHAAGDSSRFAECGPAWQPSKLYYTAIPRSRLVHFGQRLRDHGITPPFDPDADGLEIGTDDHLVTTYVDISAVVERKRLALMAHATQMGPEVFFHQLPPPLFDELFGVETFQLVHGPRPNGLETDLFAGLRD